MESFVLKNEEFFTLNKTLPKDLLIGFTTKKGGVSQKPYSALNLGLHVGDTTSHVVENRKILAHKIAFPLDTWICTEQTHGSSILEVSVDEKGLGTIQYESSLKACDGLFTKDKNILLTMCYADCVPIYFYSRHNDAIGIAHAGWKGTVKEIAGSMISVFEKSGISKEDILVVIGPSICENCYNVDKTVISFVENILEDVEEKPYNQISGNVFQLNLKRLNQLILIKYGINEENILLSNLCTSCHEEYFFSYRRDHRVTGRMMGFIGWKEEQNE